MALQRTHNFPSYESICLHESTASWKSAVLRAGLSDGSRDLAFATYYPLLSGPSVLVTALGRRFKSSVPVLSALLMSASAIPGRPLAKGRLRASLLKGIFDQTWWTDTSRFNLSIRLQSGVLTALFILPSALVMFSWFLCPVLMLHSPLCVGVCVCVFACVRACVGAPCG